MTVKDEEKHRALINSKLDDEGKRLINTLKVTD